MRKLSGIIALLFAVGILFFSCEEYNINRGETIRAGELKNMDYTLLNKNVDANDSFFIDMDNDGKDDFKLYLQSQESKTSSLHKVLVSCLHSAAFIGGFLSDDSVYFHTRYDTTSYAPLRFDTYKSTICSKTQSDDTFMNIVTKGYVYLYSIGANIISSDQWISNDILLDDSYWGLNTSKYGFLFWYGRNCFPFPINTPLYIGLKLKYSHNEKLGWMKLESKSIYEYKIIDYAIQK